MLPAMQRDMIYMNAVIAMKSIKQILLPHQGIHLRRKKKRFMPPTKMKPAVSVVKIIGSGTMTDCSTLYFLQKASQP